MSEHDSATRRPRVAVPGLVYAAIGVIAFSMTFPATALALRGFTAPEVGAGRSVLAALLAGAALILARAPRPAGRQLRGLLAVALGCGIGFGLLSAIALGDVSASHAAVVGALLPVSTAVFAVARARERPSAAFWAASLAGAGTVLAFALRRGTGQLRPADGLLLLAVLIAGLGYAEGGRLAREMPGWQVISWGLVLALPVSLPVTVYAVVSHPPHPGPLAVAGLGYVSAISMFLGFFAWYKGLARAGIARASQLQLAQPFLTLGLSMVLLGERPGLDAVVAALLVMACVAGTQQARGATTAPQTHRGGTPAQVQNLY